MACAGVVGGEVATGGDGCVTLSDGGTEYTNGVSGPGWLEADAKACLADNLSRCFCLSSLRLLKNIVKRKIPRIWK